MMYYGTEMSALYFVVKSRGVQNPMKISDIGFLKTEPNRPQNSKTEKSVSAVRFQKTDFGGLETVFHVVSFATFNTVDGASVVNSHSIFLHSVSLHFWF